MAYRGEFYGGINTEVFQFDSELIRGDGYLDLNLT